MIEKIDDWRRSEVQAIGAAISTRNWHDLESAYNSLRDKMDAALGAYAWEQRKAMITIVPPADL